jgi:malate permease and related proteins
MIVLVLLAIVVSVGAGAWAQRRWESSAQRGVERAVHIALTYVLPPCAVIIMARLEVTAGVAVGIGLGYLVLLIVGLIAWFVGSRVLGLARASVGALILAVVLSNTGYLGLPVIFVVLGGDQLGEGIAWDTLISWPMAFIVAFAIGAAFGDHGAVTIKDRLASFVRMPIVWATPVGLLLPDALAPDDLYAAVKVLASSLLPLGFFMVGVQLAAENSAGTFRFPPRLTAPVAVGVGLRMVAAPLLLLGFAAITLDLPEAYHLQAAMPCGINALLAAHTFKLDLSLGTAAIAWSTTLAVVVGGALLVVA